MCLYSSSWFTAGLAMSHLPPTHSSTRGHLVWSIVNWESLPCRRAGLSPVVELWDSQRESQPRLRHTPSSATPRSAARRAELELPADTPPTAPPPVSGLRSPCSSDRRSMRALDRAWLARRRLRVSPMQFAPPRFQPVGEEQQAREQSTNTEHEHRIQETAQAADACPLSSDIGERTREHISGAQGPCQT
jgi:hypothetical protein